ncbi:MAG TPA: phosphopantetheine-binding protein [Bacteroidales bacterium]|nr:phosphopantetheine-binding protein [Bacteroidales bacterium]
MNQEPPVELKTEIKNLIMQTLGITGIDPADIDDEKPLFGGDNALTLDSVDGLEIIMALQRKYQVRIGDQNLARNIIRSVRDIAVFIQSEQAKANG